MIVPWLSAARGFAQPISDNRMSLVRILSSMVLSHSLAASGSELPSRADCIVKIVSSAPASTRFGQDGLDFLLPYADVNNFPLAGFHVAAPDVVYIQYRSRCSERFEMSRILFSGVFPEGSVSVSEDVVTPDPETIDLFGKSWRDRPQGWIDR